MNKEHTFKGKHEKYVFAPRAQNCSRRLNLPSICNIVKTSSSPLLSARTHACFFFNKSNALGKTPRWWNFFREVHLSVIMFPAARKWILHCGHHLISCHKTGTKNRDAKNKKMKKVTGKPRFSLLPHRENWNILALRLKHIFSANQCNSESAQQTQSSGLERAVTICMSKSTVCSSASWP